MPCFPLMREQMEDLETGRIGKIGCMRMSGKSFCAVCQVAVGHIGNVVPEAAVWVLYQLSKFTKGRQREDPLTVSVVYRTNVTDDSLGLVRSSWDSGEKRGNRARAVTSALIRHNTTRHVSRCSAQSTHLTHHLIQQLQNTSLGIHHLVIIYFGRFERWCPIRASENDGLLLETSRRDTATLTCPSASMQSEIRKPLEREIAMATSSRVHLPVVAWILR